MLRIVLMDGVLHTGGDMGFGHPAGRPLHYLEVGVWKGSTFCSALCHNTLASATAIGTCSFEQSGTGMVEW